MAIRGSVAGVVNGCGAFAGSADYAECRRIHKRHGSTYYFATQRLPQPYRSRVHALYAFVRVPDEWVDNPGGSGPLETGRALETWRSDLVRGLDGVRPNHPVLRAFCDVARECRIPIDEPLAFLEAMRADLTTCRYATYADLRAYMRGSASSVGMMMCSLLDASGSPQVARAAIALGEAMQLTNFLRDVAEDAARGRIYLPLEDLDAFDLSEEELLRGARSDRFTALMRYEIERARALYRTADEGIPLLPRKGRFGVKLARVLYARILDRIEALDYDVFAQRARTSRTEKIIAALKVAIERERALT